MYLGQVNWRIKKTLKALFVLYQKNKVSIPIDVWKMIELFKIAANANWTEGCGTFRGINDIEIDHSNYGGKGLLHPSDDKRNFKIYLGKANNDFFDERLTVAHELAHIIWPESWGIFKRTSQAEETCDYIAMLILCPPFVLTKCLKKEFCTFPAQLNLFRKHKIELLRLEQMARFFQVPFKDFIGHIKLIFRESKIRGLLDRLGDTK